MPMFKYESPYEFLDGSTYALGDYTNFAHDPVNDQWLLLWEDTLDSFQVKATVFEFVDGVPTAGPHTNLTCNVNGFAGNNGSVSRLTYDPDSGKFLLSTPQVADDLWVITVNPSTKVASIGTAQGALGAAVDSKAIWPLHDPVNNQLVLAVFDDVVDTMKWRTATISGTVITLNTIYTDGAGTQMGNFWSAARDTVTNTFVVMGTGSSNLYAAWVTASGATLTVNNTHVVGSGGSGAGSMAGACWSTAEEKFYALTYTGGFSGNRPKYKLRELDIVSTTLTQTGATGDISGDTYIGLSEMSGLIENPVSGGLGFLVKVSTQYLYAEAKPDGVGGIDLGSESYVGPYSSTNDGYLEYIDGYLVVQGESQKLSDNRDHFYIGDLSQPFDTDIGEARRFFSTSVGSIAASGGGPILLNLGDDIVFCMHSGNGTNGSILIAGRVNANRTMTWGTPSNFGDSSYNSQSIGKISATKVAVSTRFADGNTYMAVATVNPTTLAITFGPSLNCGTNRFHRRSFWMEDAARLVVFWGYFSTEYVTQYSLSGDTFTQNGFNGTFQAGTQRYVRKLSGSKLLEVYASTKTYTRIINVGAGTMSGQTGVQLAPVLNVALSESQCDFDAVNNRLHVWSENNTCGHFCSIVWDGANSFTDSKEEPIGVDASSYDYKWMHTRQPFAEGDPCSCAYDAYSNSLLVCHKVSNTWDVAYADVGIGASALPVVGGLTQPALAEPGIVWEPGTYTEGTGLSNSAMIALDDSSSGGAVVVAHGSANDIAYTVLKAEAFVRKQNLCDIKPTTRKVVKPAAPGEPYYPGQAYRPAYCVQDPCYEVRSGSASPGYTYRCVTYLTNDSLVAGQQTSETICGYFPTGYDPNDPGSEQSVDPYAPNYDPNPDTTSEFGGTGFLQGSVTRICPDPVCYPAIPYIPPTPPTPPTPAVYAIDYNLGWNYDVLLGTGANISVDINTDRISRSTAGILVGFSEFVNYKTKGTGKYKLFALFEGNKVSAYINGSLVWGPQIRQQADVVKLMQSGSQGIVFLNDVVVAQDLSLYSGKPVVCAANIYKAGDSVCVTPTEELGSITYASDSPTGTGDGDVLLPGLIGAGYEGTYYAIGDVTLPVVDANASTGNHGGADIDLPAFFGIGAEDQFGYADVLLPVYLEVSAYESAALSGYAEVELPNLSAVGSDISGYAFGDVLLPSLDGEGEVSSAIPAAQGADVNIPFIIGLGVGATGSIGGVQNALLPAIEAIASEGAYGEAYALIPALTAWGAEVPVYSGVLYGEFSSLEMSQGYGTTYPPNTLDGSIDGLEGDLWGGAYLNQDLGGLEVVTMTGTVTNVGRLDGTFLPMEMNSTGLVGAYGELAGRLGDPLEGELLGGAFLEGSIPGLVGELSATLGVVGRLDGTFSAMTGELSGTVQATGRADVTLPALEMLWGILDGYLPGLSGSLAQTAITVQDYTAWVMNMKTGAISRYPAYAFNFLCRWHDGNYIVREDGIYLIGGEYDIDQPIEAGFTLPSTDMGVSTEKIAPRLYMQGRMDGQFAVTTMADELDPVRSVSIIRPGVGYHRCKLPRGIRGTHLEFDVDNVSGADFEIEQVDVLVADSGRKI